MPSRSIPKRPRSTTLAIVALWIVFYSSFTLVHPALLDDADSVHAEVAREMLLRHDYVTLYANGIRYLEKAPLLYWTMAACMRLSQLLGYTSSRSLATAARIPLALTILALAFAVEAFARRAFHRPGQDKTAQRAGLMQRTGLYAALITLSSPGLFLFTRITLPDAMVCLWLTLALLAFWLTEQTPRPQMPSSGTAHPKTPSSRPKPTRSPSSRPERPTIPSSRPEPQAEWRDPRIFSGSPQHLRPLCFAFAACCALNVLTKGLIGLVFPIAIVALYLILTRGLRGAITRIGQLHPVASTAIFLAIAAPWHILIALANPTQGHPGSLAFTHGHWAVPLPSDGNVHGWAWFYFVNEQLLRYLNLRVPRDYDTVPLYLFYGLCLIWLMPWSAFIFKALAHALRNVRPQWPPHSRSRDTSVLLKDTASAVPIQPRDADAALAAEGEARRRTNLLLLLWAAIPLIFFSFSTRQEYYVLPALPALILLIAAWLAYQAPTKLSAQVHRRSAYRCTAVLALLGALFAAASIYFLIHARTPAPNTDLATLLRQNPSDYALSMGHFLDLNALALALFRLPLALAALSLSLGPLASCILRKRAQPHPANLALAAGAFGFLLAAHLGLQTFAPVLSSQQLAAAIAPQLHADDLIVIHQEYEYASTLGFYLQRPAYAVPTGPGAPHLASEMWDGSPQNSQPIPINPIHILTDPDYNGTPDYGRSSNLWYGSFFPDAPHIFETNQSLAQKWPGPQRIFLWQDLANQPSPLPAALTPVYVIARSGGKEIVSNQPTR